MRLAVMTVTVAELDPEPPGPLHVTVYVVVADGLTELLPDVPLAEKFGLEQEVAFDDDQYTVEEPPGLTELGLAETDSEGGGGGGPIVTEEFAEPLAPVQVMVYVV